METVSTLIPLNDHSVVLDKVCRRTDGGSSIRMPSYDLKRLQRLQFCEIACIKVLTVV
ncbi:MAG: hypothetical protein Q4A75_01640 [Peptostreptococcaceae bacterium]|nr:hypothetical protein [Peptostreptococcaceae bacterium]